MRINDHNELLAMLRAIMEAKFEHSLNSEIVGSPYLASVANRIVDALIKIEKERGEFSSRKWENWRKIDSRRREWKLIRKRIKAVAQWGDWSVSERGKFLDLLLSPLVVGNEDRERILK